MVPSVLKIFIDGQHIDERSPGVILQNVEIRQELNQHWWCEIVCRQTEDRRFPIEGCLGKDLKLEASDENQVTYLLFDGLVLEAELEYEIYGSYTARILGVTRSYKLDLTPRQKFYPTTSIVDIGQALTGQAGLSFSHQVEVKDTPKFYLQYGETDFAFLNRLADDHGCWLRPAPDGIQISNAFVEQSPLQWRGEDGLLTFKLKGKLGQPSMNGCHYFPGDMESKTYTEVKEEPQFYESAGPMVDAVKQMSQDKLPPGYVYQRSRMVFLESYEKLLKKESVRAIGGKITGWGVSRNPDLRPGREVKIDGVLDGSGVYGLTRVVHQWTTHGYQNEFWCTPWKNWVNVEAPKMREWTGVVPARVVANDDPRQAGRVAVKFFWQEDDSNSGWIRTMTPHAGQDRGFYFLPEIGDEVVVGFEDGDAEKPLVLGSIWNGVDKAPVQEFWGGEYEKDDCKRIVTKSGHRIQMVDKEGKESIAIATPKYLKITLIEKTDETGRSAISICSSNGDIILSAPNGRIHFRSKFFSREVG